MIRRQVGWILIFVGTIMLVRAVWSFPIVRLLWNSPRFLGDDRPKTYLVLLQNNTELRPTGGFLGSFALVRIDRGKPTVSVHDIYSPDGQVRGRVDPPQPIQDAFQLGEWRLRDANWNPDFSAAVRDIGWFMDKAGITGIDGTIATNLFVFQELLRLTGPIDLSDYRDTVTTENLWEKGEQYSQDDSFPGSIQKREFLADLASSFRRTLSRLSLAKKVRSFVLIGRMLREKHILVAVNDSNVQHALDGLGWSGRVTTPSCPWWNQRCVKDSLMIVEANLGVNKANCCIDRSAELDVEVDGMEIRHNLTLTFTNNSSKDRWGGRYLAWVRVLVMGREHGFWANVPEGETRNYDVSYRIKNDFSLTHQLINPSIIFLVQKQSGVDRFPIVVTVTRGDNTKRIEWMITTDTRLVL